MQKSAWMESTFSYILNMFKSLRRREVCTLTLLYNLETYIKHGDTHKTFTIINLLYVPISLLWASHRRQCQHEQPIYFWSSGGRRLKDTAKKSARAEPVSTVHAESKWTQL
jgi:hypothetical protein